MKLPTIPPGLDSGQDRKKLPALGTNQIAGFGGFRPQASLEKNKYICIELLLMFVMLSFSFTDEIS